MQPFMMLSFFCRFTYWFRSRCSLTEDTYLPGSSSKKQSPTPDSSVTPDQAVQEEVNFLHRLISIIILVSVDTFDLDPSDLPSNSQHNPGLLGPPSSMEGRERTQHLLENFPWSLSSSFCAGTCPSGSAPSTSPWIIKCNRHKKMLTADKVFLWSEFY